MSDLLFMRLDGIDGEEPIGADQKLIRIDNYSHRLSMPSAPMRPSAGPDATMRRSYCDHGLFIVNKALDMTTPKLLAAAANGVVFPNVAIYVGGTDYSTLTNVSKPDPFITIIMTDAIIADFAYGFDGEWQTEKIAWRYTSIGWEVKWTNPDDGSAAQLEPVGWKGDTNKAATVSVPSAVEFGGGGLL